MSAKTKPPAVAPTPRRETGSLGPTGPAESVERQDNTAREEGRLEELDGSDWEVDTDPQREAPLPSVVLDPELEPLAERHHGTGRKKEKKPRAKK